MNYIKVGAYIMLVMKNNVDIYIYIYIYICYYICDYMMVN